jgi:hypothetical protein
MAQARIGRPPKSPTPGERIGMSLRVTPEMKNQLERAALANGRSLSQEAEFRLQQSFRDDDLLPRLLAAAYGPRLAGVLMMIGSAMSAAGRSAGFSQTFTLEGSTNWMDLAWPYHQARGAAEQVLATLRPEGEIDVPKSVEAVSNNDAMPVLKGWAENLGAGFANSYMSAAVQQGATEELRRWSEPVRDLLGPEVLNRLEARLTGRHPGKRGSK